MIPKGPRVLGIDSGNSAEWGPGVDAFFRAQAAGAEATSLCVNWDQVEPAPRVYVDPFNILTTAAQFYPAHNSRISFTIRPIDANSKTVPPDLRDVAFNNPVMIERFTTMIGWVLERMKDVSFTSIQIGNEIDKYVGFDVASYAEFVYWANVKVKSVRPDIKVGYTATWDGLVRNPTKDLLVWLNAYVDVVGVTYYPIEGNFQVRLPTCVQSDFDGLMRNYPEKAVFFQEVGYPSGPLCSSSEAQQSEFVQNVFAAWDRYPNNIGYLSFVRVHDWPKSTADSVASGPPYHLPYPEFSEFMRTLGLRTYPGTGQDKQAMTTLARESSARGWKLTASV
jgi:hypothetical protein